MPEKQPFTLAVAIPCLDLMRLGDECAALEQAGISDLFFPVGDGDVAPFISGFDLARQVTANTALRCHLMLLSRHPERHVDAAAAAGFASLTFLLEASTHAHRILSRIREAGMTAGVAINPLTSLTALEYLLEKSDRVALLGVEPTGAQNVIAPPGIGERVRLLRENIRYRELQTGIMACCGLSLEQAGQALAEGASAVVMDGRLMGESGADIAAEAAVWCRARLAEVMSGK